MRKIKHFAGYGTVKVGAVKDSSCTLHVRVEGNHEWGIVRDDDYTLYNWLVKRFDKTVPDYPEWHRQLFDITIHPDLIRNDPSGVYTDTCDYYFTY